MVRSVFRNVFPKDDLKTRGMFLEGFAADGAGQQAGRLASFDARILVDHRIHSAREQQGF